MNFSREIQDSGAMKTSGSNPLLCNDDEIDDAEFGGFGKAARKFLYKHVPITYWLPKYSLDSLFRDITAGVTVGLMVVPQGLAYATIANLPVQYGLYSAYLGCFVYCVFGGCKEIAFGPTSTTSLMVSRFDKGEPHYAITLALVGGLVQFLLGVTRLGFLVRFISIPVHSGLVSAIAFTIGFGQMKHLLGLKRIPRDFLIRNCINTFKHIKETNPWDLLLGFCCIVLLFLLRKLNRMKWEEDEYVPKWQRVCRKFLWLLSTARNALVVVLAASVVKAVESMSDKKGIFTLTKEVEGGIPEFRVSNEVYLCDFIFLALIHQFNSSV